MQTLRQIEIRRGTLFVRKRKLECKAWQMFQDGHWASLAKAAQQIANLDMLIRELDQVMDG